jgi:hypothetical protein
MRRGQCEWGVAALWLLAGVSTLATGGAQAEPSASQSSHVAPTTHGAPVPIPRDALPALQSLDISQGPALAPPENAPAPNQPARVALRPTPAKSPATGDETMSEKPTTTDEEPQGARPFVPRWLPPSAAISEAFGAHNESSTTSSAPRSTTLPTPSGGSTTPAPSTMPLLEPPVESESVGSTASTPAPFEADGPARPLASDSKADEKRATPAPREVTTEPKTAPRPEVRSEPTGEATRRVAPPEPRVTAAPLKPLTRNEIYLRNKMRKVLNYYYQKPLNSAQHDTWEVMHGVLAYGLDSRIRQGGPRGEPITAIGWLCYNRPCKQKQLLQLNDEGEIRALYGVGLQGHMGQFLAMLAQSNVDRNYPIQVDGKMFTIEDLIVAEQKTCYSGTELTFKLISLMHYLPSDSTWLNDRGETWSIERLIEEELKQPIRSAACGGTHRLAGLSLAARKRELRGEPLDGVWAQAADFTESYEQYAYRLQNSDGSFSTQWFKGSEADRDIDRRIKTSGHILEWLIYQSTDEELDSSRLVRGVNYVTNLLYSNSDRQWEIGPQCHALHALQLYNQRKFVPYDEAAPMAGSSRGDQTAQAGRGQSAPKSNSANPSRQTRQSPGRSYR